MGVNNMYEYHKGIKTGSDWSLQRAEAILQNWEREFAKVRNDLSLVKILRFEIGFGLMQVQVSLRNLVVKC